MHWIRRGRATWRAVVPAVSAAAVLGAVTACGGGGGGKEPPLSAAAAAGKQVAVSSGCAVCHQFYGKDAAGPTWKGLYGSEVELDDGTKLIADDAYLTQSIKDPRSQKVKGFATVMPKNSLSDEQVAAIVAYIKELDPGDG